MDALELLTRDHELVKQLMTKIDGEKDAATRISLFEQLIDELTIHERIEEEYLYPALKALPKAKEDVLEAFEEHHLVDQIVSGLDETKPSDETWPAKFTVLKESLEHHIEEEETTLFEKAEKLLGRERLGELGVKMRDLKEAEQQALGEQERASS